MQTSTSWMAVIAAIGFGLAPAAFADNDDEVEGSWYVTVHVTTPAGLPDYDALYAFGKGGVFTRIDGRNNAPAVGTWERTGDHDILFSSFLFNFAGGVVPTPATRNGAIMAVITAHVEHGMMTGTFAGIGILGLANFYRAGTFTATKIQPDGTF